MPWETREKFAFALGKRAKKDTLNLSAQALINDVFLPRGSSESEQVFLGSGRGGKIKPYVADGLCFYRAENPKKFASFPRRNTGWQSAPKRD